MRRMGATRSYITGMCHDVSHEEFEEILSGLEGPSLATTTTAAAAPPGASSDVVRQGQNLVGEGKPLWARPAYDGLRLVVTSDGTVADKSKGILEGFCFDSYICAGRACYSDFILGMNKHLHSTVY